MFNDFSTIIIITWYSDRYVLYNSQDKNDDNYVYHKGEGGRELYDRNYKTDTNKQGGSPF